MLGGLQSKHNFTIPPDDLENYVTLEEDRVIAKLKEKLVPCEGVMPVLERLSKSKKYHLSVVSSSAKRRIIASIEKVDQAKYFHPVDDLVFSAATSLETPTSKPDPAIYLFALKKLGVTDPKAALAVEDSKSGATAGIRAGIPVIGFVGFPVQPQYSCSSTDMLARTRQNRKRRRCGNFSRVWESSISWSTGTNLRDW